MPKQKIEKKMYKVTYIDLIGKTKETEISKSNQVKELGKLREKGFTILKITKITKKGRKKK